MLDPVIKRLLTDLFRDAQQRLDALKLKYPDATDAVEQSYLSGFNFSWSRNGDLDLMAQSNISPAEYDQAWQEFNQKQTAGLN